MKIITIVNIWYSFAKGFNCGEFYPGLRENALLFQIDVII